MEVYKGIPISEAGLLTHNMLLSILLLTIVVVFVIFVCLSKPFESNKAKRHIRKLKREAKYNEFARAQLKKIECREKRRWDQEKDEKIADRIVGIITLCIIVGTLFGAVIPGWLDYTRKDYVVYSGEIAVNAKVRQSRIELSDGTIVRGRGDFGENDTYGTVVYSKRTNRFVGGIK